MEINIWILMSLVFLGFIAALIDSSFGMGYGILTPVMIFMGFDPILVVPVLLLSQMSAGFTGTIFHSIYENVDLDSKEKRDVKITIVFTIFGMIGMGSAIFLAVSLPEFYMVSYIGIMTLVVGIILIKQISFQFSWNKIYFISGLAAFNKAITGGGYGPIATTGQIVTGRDHDEAVAVSIFSEAFLSGFGFLLYFILTGFANTELLIPLLVVMIISSIVATPLGALIPKKISKKKGKKVIGWVSIILGILTIGRLLIPIIAF